MKFLLAAFILIPVLCCSCGKSKPSSKVDADELMRLITWRGDGKDLSAELGTFYRDIRLRYNERQFDELEIIAQGIRDQNLKFSNGEWKIEHFYGTFTCRDDEPESMWQLHDQIHKEWIAKFPDSATAKIAHARFMMEYAWHARGDDYADKVDEKNLTLFKDRLAKANRILDGCSKQRSDCPMWSLTRMKVALGLQAELQEFDKLFRQAKADEPNFSPNDILRAYYLLPRWYGSEGEWEKAALNEIFLEDGGGVETYAKVIMAQKRFYENIFDETEADWEKAKSGFQKMLLSDPDSRINLNVYCLLACLAGDQTTAHELFEKIGDTPVPTVWRVGKINTFEDAKQWAALSQI